MGGSNRKVRVGRMELKNELGFISVPLLGETILESIPYDSMNKKLLGAKGIATIGTRTLLGAPGLYY